MYASTPTRGSPQRKDIPEGPILDFRTLIEKTRAEQWEKRTMALQSLVDYIPSSPENRNEEAWYNSAPTLRHLAPPLTELLRDPRSSVVKRTCVSLQSLFGKCQEDARFLFKDIMPTILGVHAQTVQVIRGYVQNMVLATMPVVPCKMTMPLWIERLKSDKSRTVREACALYLGKALMHWSGRDGYITDDIWMQVGTIFLRRLRDPSPTVRNYSKLGLDYVQEARPELWDRLRNDPEGPAAKDRRLQKLLQRGEFVSSSIEELSVGSKTSFASQQQHTATSPRRAHSTANVTRSFAASTSSSRNVPSSIAVGRSRSMGGLGPPQRVAAPFGHAVDSPHTGNLSNEIMTPNSAASQSDMDLSKPFDFNDDNPFIDNLDALKEHAKGRRSRRSSFIEERLKSARGSDDGNNVNDYLPDALHTALEDEAPSEPEHMVVARQLLEAHKKHVDQIMETLKIEMATLGEFEQVLLDELSPHRPSDEEVLEYFECVGLCLDQRTTAGNVLRREMDKISRGS